MNSNLESTTITSELPNRQDFVRKMAVFIAMDKKKFD